MKNLNHRLIQSVRGRLADQRNLEEKTMFGGLTFMVNGKMCVCVVQNGLLCRIGPARYAKALEADGCTPMEMGGRTMRDYVLVDENVLQNKHDVNHWVELCLDFNPGAKAAKSR